jgi:hypothetical protein
MSSTTNGIVFLAAMVLVAVASHGCITEDNCLDGTTRIDGRCQPTSGTDGGPRTDAGPLRDGGGRDTGTDFDAGRADAGQFDAGPFMDGSMMCDAGSYDCGGSCVDIATNADHCGGCDRVCDPINATTAACDEARCTFTCSANFADVDGDGSNGCEVNLRNDPRNCGEVGYDCMIGDCVLGTCTGRRLVFATSRTFNGNLGGFAGAAEKCQEAAIAAGLRGRFLPWISYSRNSPSSTFDTLVTDPYVRTDGTVVAAGWRGLTTSGPRVPINIDENGRAVTYTNAWTETLPTGNARTGTTSAFGSCTGWTVTLGNGGYGRVNEIGTTWTVAGGALNCTLTFGLYCFENPPRL